MISINVFINRRLCQSPFIIQKKDFSKRDYRAVFGYFSINTAKYLTETREKAENRRVDEFVLSYQNGSVKRIVVVLFLADPLTLTPIT